ncbi:MAG: 2-polyprenylphenol 6-hydroxylase [Alphaproteobacteria bacterium]|nr:2-polyprenylphenol 6-hydroxylase [Alphaproteobacteria bacterium]
MALRALLRLMRMGVTLARHDALVPPNADITLPPGLGIVQAVFRPFRQRGLKGLRYGQRLALACESMGPSAIKFGQFLATRADILGPEIANDLTRLQDRMPPFPQRAAEAAVSAAFGAPVPSLFETFDRPIAAASIAQVHRARLAVPTEGGETQMIDVAVKILRPGIAERFRDDLAAFAAGAAIVERFGGAEGKRLRPREVIETLKRSVAIELDLRLEGAAASELAERMQDDPQFRVPAVIWERTSQGVLTTEWIVGHRLRTAEGLVAAGHDPKRIARQIVQSFLTQALRHGFFHADLHPGNLFVDEKGRLAVVDFGIMGRLSAEMRRFMAETLYGFLTRDYARVAIAHFDVGFVPRTHTVEDFALALRSIGEPVFGRTSDQISMARLLAQLFEVTRLFDMPAQPQLVFLQKTMVVVEGVARELDPSLNIWETSRPVVEAWMREEMGPEARLREAADGVSAIGRVIGHLPDVARNLETVAAITAEGGLRLHPETITSLARAEARGQTLTRAALWIGALALAVLTATQL